MYPRDSRYLIFAGIVVVVNVVDAEPDTPPDFVFTKTALVKSLPEISAPLKSPFVKSYPLKSSSGPIMCRAVTLYPLVMALGCPAILLDWMRVKREFARFAPETSTLEMFTPEKSEPLKSTPGPTM